MSGSSNISNRGAGSAGVHWNRKESLQANESTPTLLAGIRVLEAATLAAGPLAATYLGEFGAEVIKIEQPLMGDPIRSWGVQSDGVGLAWKSVARNKKCITLDLHHPDGQAMFRRLAGLCDVVVVNTRPQTLKSWGLDYEALCSLNERLVMLHITGFGLVGPKADRPGFGTLGEAMSGFAHLTGEADAPPTLPQFPLADGVASLTAAYAVMMALYHRDVHGGRGQLIDINLIDPLSRLMEPAVLSYDQTGAIPTRSGNRWAISAPRNLYRTRDDRWIAVSASSPSMVLRVFRALGTPDLVEKLNFNDPQCRLAHADEVDTMVAAWVAGQDLAEVMAIFDREEVAAAPVYDVAQLINDEHIKARNVFVRVPDGELTELRVQAPVPRFSHTVGRINHLGPRLGEHNQDVYHSLLGVTDEELRNLQEKGIV